MDAFLMTTFPRNSITRVRDNRQLGSDRAHEDTENMHIQSSALSCRCSLLRARQVNGQPLRHLLQCTSDLDSFAFFLDDIMSCHRSSDRLFMSKLDHFWTPIGSKQYASDSDPA